MHLILRTPLRTKLSAPGPRIRPYEVARASFGVPPTEAVSAPPDGLMVPERLLARATDSGLSPIRVEAPSTW